MPHYTRKTGLIDYFVSNTSFPCVAAKSASARGNIVEIVYGDLDNTTNDAKILDDISQFISAPHEAGSFRSFVAAFQGPAGLTELQFEEAMWDRLQALHDLDAVSCEWDGSVSSDPECPDFSFSLRGKAFFVIGLHPDASRLSRRYCRPALVFNLHEQFETLRREGRYERMRDVIRKRDAALCGSMNPALQNFGEQSEARQYSGCPAPENWQCPFRARQKRQP